MGGMGGMLGCDIIIFCSTHIMKPANAENMLPENCDFVGTLSHAPELQYIFKTLLFFEGLLREEASEQRIPVEIVRALRPCRICIILAKDAFYCVLLEARESDEEIKTVDTDDQRHSHLSVKDAECIGRRYLIMGRNAIETITLRFPAECLEGNAEEKANLLMPLVQKYLVFEISWAKQKGLLTVPKPFFPGKHFTVDANLAFVLMPFASEFEDIYLGCIKPVIEKQISKCVRADDIFHNQPIVEVIWQHINRAMLIVADLTSRNPNVFYEVGIAHTLGKEVVLLSQTIEDVPFDLRHLNVIVYKWTPPGAEKLKVALGATIKSIVTRERKSYGA